VNVSATTPVQGSIFAVLTPKPKSVPGRLPHFRNCENVEIRATSVGRRLQLFLTNTAARSKRSRLKGLHDSGVIVGTTPDLRALNRFYDLRSRGAVGEPAIGSDQPGIECHSQAEISGIVYAQFVLVR
jgi:hypothetical protein